MKLKYLRLKNFLSYGDSELEFVLDGKSPTLIYGKNGSGKTTLLVGIIYAIYGKTPVRIDNIVNWKTKKNCKIELCFNIGKDEYNILRYRQHENHGNKIYLFKNKKDISFKNTGDTEQLIQDIVQINYDVFKSSIVLSPEIYTSFLRAKNSDRLKVVENIFTLGFINEYAAILKDLRKNLTNEIEKVKGEKEKANSVLETIESSIKSYKENALRILSSLKEEKSKLKEKMEKLLDEIEDLEKINVDEELNKIDIFENNEIIDRKINDQESKKVNIHFLNNELLKLEQEYKELTVLDIIEEKSRIKKYDEIIINNKDVSVKIERIDNLLKQSQSIENSLEKINEEIDDKEKEIQDVKEHIEICSQCKQKVDISFNKEFILNKEKELRLLINNKNDILKEFNKINKSELLKEKELLVSSYKTIPEKSKYNLEQLEDIGNRINVLLKNIGILKSKIEDGNKANSNINETISDLKKDKGDLEEGPKYTRNFLEELSQNIFYTQEDLRKTEKEIEIIEEKAKTVYDRVYIEEMEDKKNKAKKIIDKIEKKLEKFLYEDKHYEVLNQLFSNKDNGFKKYVIDKMLPIFNKHINFYITFFFNMEINLTFDKELTPLLKREGIITEIESFSSGMKTRLDLSIMFALFMMVKTFFSSSVNIMFLDEVLDLHLDDEGVQGVFNIIESLSKTNNVFIISHRDVYKDKIKNKIEFSMVDDLTRISFK